MGYSLEIRGRRGRSKGTSVDNRASGGIPPHFKLILKKIKHFKVLSKLFPTAVHPFLV